MLIAKSRSALAHSLTRSLTKSHSITVPNSLPHSLTPMSHPHPHQHHLIPPTPSGLSLAASLIQAGQLVAFPTETVYGLGANALDAVACTSIFTAKGRPMTDPLIVHVADPSVAVNGVVSGAVSGTVGTETETSSHTHTHTHTRPLVAIEGPTLDMFNRLAAEFWPGPLTIIVKADECIPPEVTANTGFVGIRCPNHPLTLKFLTACGLPVAGPSANLFGHVSPTLAHHVLDDLGAKGVRVLDGDSDHSSDTCLHGIESTVVKLGDSSNENKNQITILRQGAVSQAQLEHIAKNIEGEPWTVVALQRQVLMESTEESEPSHASKLPSREIEQSQGEVAPGQALTHYAPYIPCYSVASCRSCVSEIQSFNDKETVLSNKIATALEKYDPQNLTITTSMLKTVVVLDFLGQLSHLSSHCLAYRDLSSDGNPSEAAKSLFSFLRWAELQPNATKVFVAPIISADNSDKISPSGVECADNKSKYDLFFGLSDRLFRATSGASVHIIIE